MKNDPEDRHAHTLAAEERRNERDRWSDDAIDRTPLIGRRGIRRLFWIGAAVVLVVLLATLPPLLNVSHYQRRVASAIAGSIGRPVRFDTIELHLLPLPGFTIHNFVVVEDGAFGAEPAMRANVVEARVRVSSLWRRRVEISHITLQSPSVNLVRNAAGFWNLQGVVSQAAQVQSAPTAQATAGDAPRFPYIEASDARINLKLGDTKQPFALTDATFALWLPDADAWHLRLAGRPMRTDTDVSDVGELRVEATLGRRAATAALQPLRLDATWKATPLGEASKLALGNDAGWRGSVSGEAHLQGTPGAMHVTSDLHVRDLRRAEFVPAHPMEMDAHCEAYSIGMFYGLHAVRCALPTGKHGSLLDELPFFRNSAATAIAPDVLTLEAEVPSLASPTSVSASVNLTKASPAWALQWMQLFSTRMVPTEVEGTMSLVMNRMFEETQGEWRGVLECRCVLPLEATTDSTSETPKSVVTPWNLRVTHLADAASPFSVAIGASPAANPDSGFAGTADSTALVLHYTSAETARVLAGVVPALADDLPPALTGEATSTRAWGAAQVWSSPAPAVAAPARKRGHRR